MPTQHSLLGLWAVSLWVSKMVAQGFSQGPDGDRSLSQLLSYCFTHLVLEVGTFLPFRLEFHPLIVWDLEGRRRNRS